MVDSCTVANGAETSLAWVGPGQPAIPEVSIVLAAGNDLLLAGRSTGGSFFCIARSSGPSEYGRGVAFADIDTLPECVGGW